MYIVAAILIFVFGAIGAALNGDYSGFFVIGEVLMVIGIVFFLGCILSGFSTDGSGTIFLISIVMVIVGVLLAGMK